MIPGFLPKLTLSHYQYAALMWILVISLWSTWGRTKSAQTPTGTS
jgi:hypothetical protein